MIERKAGQDLHLLHSYQMDRGTKRKRGGESSSALSSKSGGWKGNASAKGKGKAKVNGEHSLGKGKGKGKGKDNEKDKESSLSGKLVCFDPNSVYGRNPERGELTLSSIGDPPFPSKTAPLHLPPHTSSKESAYIRSSETPPQDKDKRKG